MNRPFLPALFFVLAVVFIGGCKREEKPAGVSETGDPVAAIASLSDPKKLATLKPENRAVNGRMDKILYWLYVAEQRGMKPDAVMGEALTRNKTTEPRGTMAKKQTLANYTAAKRWGLFTIENLDRLKRGNAAIVTKGSYVGEKAEIDHIAPVSRYPQFANELANLQIMPAPQNRSKGDRMGKVEFEKLAELQKLIPPAK